MGPLLETIDSPANLRNLTAEELEQLATEIREELVNTIQGHRRRGPPRLEPGRG